MKNKIKIISIIVSMVLALSACGKDTTIVLTTGFAQDEVFKIEGISCSKDEINLYLTNMQNKYENIFGEEFWEKQVDGVSLEENIKENILAKIAQVKSLNLLAKEQKMELSEEEAVLAKAAANQYFQSLNEVEKEYFNLSEQEIEQMYTEYFLAEKVYHDSIKEINLEVSDDEARTVLVQQIVFNTYEFGANNVQNPVDTNTKAKIYELAQSVLKLAREEDASFESLAAMYSDSDDITVAIGKGDCEIIIEDTVFNLNSNEISSIIEGKEGYYIIKCMSPFNQEETDINKEKIIEKRKQEAFLLVYDEFVNNLTRNLNNKVWEQVTMVHDDHIKTSNFFDIADEFYSN